jgi:hypothetical protein
MQLQRKLLIPDNFTFHIPYHTPSSIPSICVFFVNVVTTATNKVFEDDNSLSPAVSMERQSTSLFVILEPIYVMLRGFDSFASLLHQILACWILESSFRSGSIHWSGRLQICISDHCTSDGPRKQRPTSSHLI